MPKRSHLPPELKKRALRYHDLQPGYFNRFEDALNNAKAKPEVFELLGQKMTKVVFKSGTSRKGCILIMSNGQVIENNKYNQSGSYYDPATQKFYDEFITKVPEIAHSEIVKMVLNEGANSFESIVSTMSARLGRNIPENITEQIITGYALEEIPKWFNTPVKDIVKLKDQPYRSSGDLTYMVQYAFSHWATINKDSVYDMDFNGETVFSMIRKYLSFKKLEGMNS